MALTLLVAYSAGVQAVTLIVAGNLTRCKEVFQSYWCQCWLSGAPTSRTMRAKSCVKRFNMAKECLWR